MSEQARSLVSQFEQANDKLMALVKRFSRDEWRTTAADDKRAVGVVAHHVASSYATQAGLIEKMAAQQEVPAITWDMVNGMNAEHAEQYTRPDREETLALLRQNGQTVAQRIRELDDTQLRRTWDLPFVAPEHPATMQQFIEEAIIDHIDLHRRSMEAATGK